MNRKYVKPNVVKYGTYKMLIQGDCGWGVENLTLDKTGYYKKNWRFKYYPPCPGPDPNGKVNCPEPICKVEKKCAKNHQC